MEGQSLATVKVNTYLALLVITVVGAGASMFIIRVAYATYLPSTASGGEYAALQQSLLSQ